MFSQATQGDGALGTIHEVEFHGTTAEYFRIWIVNLVLSIVTLGIYSAWATVRTRRYFLGNTVIDGSSFDYHASPVTILRGRLIAVAVLLLLNLGDFLHVSVIPVVMLLLVCIFPWLFRSALRFRRRMTSYRNVRFDFHGTTGQALAALWPALLVIGAFVMLTVSVFFDELGDTSAALSGISSVLTSLSVLILFSSIFLYPVLQYLMSRYAIAESAFGRQKFSTVFTASDFGGLYLRTIGVNIVAGMVGLLGALVILATIGFGNFLQADDSGPGIMIWVVLLIAYGWFGVCSSASVAYWAANKRNLLANQSRLGEVHLSSNMVFSEFWLIQVQNWLAIVFSLGFAYPWASIRLARYHAQTLRIEGDLNAFVAAQPAGSSAVGDEMADILDLDVGF